MLRYHVRARDLVSLVGDLNEGRLIMSPYFQRNLVWRDIHKRDFIDTILKGLPFPQIFIAQGDIDVETLNTRAVIVDGQQRVNSIREFINGSLEVNGVKFASMEKGAKEEFLRYQIPVIDLDIKAADPQIVDIFKRLNRTFYSLSSIERMSTEYSTVDLMLIAKYSSGSFKRMNFETDEDYANSAELHPLMPEDFFPWAESFEVDNFQEWLLKSEIFTEFEIARQVHLMFTLNILSTAYFGFFARNEKTREFLEEAREIFPFRDELMLGIELAATIIKSLELPKDSIWTTKSNSFSLFIVCFWHSQAITRMGSDVVREKLLDFGKSLTPEYALAAREAVNNRKQRVFRHEAICECLGLPKEERMLR